MREEKADDHEIKLDKYGGRGEDKKNKLRNGKSDSDEYSRKRRRRRIISSYRHNNRRTITSFSSQSDVSNSQSDCDNYADRKQRNMSGERSSRMSKKSSGRRKKKRSPNHHSDSDSDGNCHRVKSRKRRRSSSDQDGKRKKKRKVMKGGEEIDHVEAAEKKPSLNDIGPMPIGPMPLPRTELGRIGYGGALRPGEGEAIARYVKQGKRIPRRGEVSYSPEEIQKLQSVGYVMSGSRNVKMDVVRIRKENQVYSAEDKRALATFNYEEKVKREQKVMDDLKRLVQRQLDNKDIAYANSLKNDIRLA